MFKPIIRGAFFVASLILVAEVRAATNDVWSGATDTNFQNAANWVGGAAPANDTTTSIAEFPSAVTTNQPALSAGQNLNGLQFDAAAGGWTLGNGGGNTLGIGSGGINDSAQTSGTVSIAPNIQLDAPQTWTVGTGGTLSVAGATNANNTITVGTSAATAGTLIMGGATDNVSTAMIVNYGLVQFDKVSTSGIHVIGGGLTINNSATVQFTGSGGYQIYPGTGVTINNSATLDMYGQNNPMSSLNGNGGQVTNTNASTTSLLTLTNGGNYGGSIQDGAGAVALTVSGSTLTLGGANAYSGATSITGGTLVLNGSNTGSTSPITLSGGATLTIGASGSLGSGLITNAGTINFGNSGSISVAAPIANSGAINFGSGNVALAGVLSGAGALNLNGSGTVTFNNANTYSAVTTINAGTLQIGAGGTFGTANVVDNSNVAFDRADTTLSISNAISGTGSVNNLGSGTVTLAGVNSYAGGTTVSAGTLALSGAGTLGAATGSLVVNGTLTLDGTNQIVGPLSGGSLASIQNTSSTNSTLVVGQGTSAASSATFAGTISDGGTGTLGLTVAGLGTEIFTGANTYTGPTLLAGGTLQIGDGVTAGSLGASSLITFGGGALNIVGVTGTSSATTIGPVAFNSGDSALQLTAAAGTTATLNTGAISREAGATGNFVTIGSGTATISSSSLATGFLGAGYFFNGSNYAYNDPSGFVRGINYGVDANSATSLTAGNYVQLTNATTPIGADTSVNTLALSGANSVTITPGATLTLTNGGLLATGGASTIDGGALQAGSGVELIARVDQATDSLAISSTIGDNGTTPLTKSGLGTLTLSGTNTYAGPTTIDGGVLSTNLLAAGGAASGIGQSSNAASNLVLAGGTLQYTGAGASTDRLFTLGAAGGGIDSSGTGALNFTNTGAVAFGATASPSTLTLTGGYTGSANSFAPLIGDQSATDPTSLVKSGAGTWALPSANTYSGSTTINGGMLTASTLALGGAASSIGQSTNLASNLVLNGGTLQYVGASAATTDHLFTLSASGGTLDSSSTSTADPVNFSNTGAIAMSGSGARTLTLTGSNTGTFTNAGNGFGASPAGTANVLMSSIADGAGGATSLDKTGTGSWVVYNANTYSGGTTVSSGALIAYNSTALGSGAVNVASGAQLVFGPSGLNVANNITLNGIVTAANSAIGLSGALVGGVYTGGVTNTYSGTLTLAATSNLSTDWSDKTLNITGLVTGPGGLQLDLSAVNHGVPNVNLVNAANTYQGPTIVNSGVLGITSLAVEGAGGGMASSVGQSGNAAENLIINGGTLQYTGVGSTTDRLFSVGSASATIDSSGSGPLNFTNTGAMGFNSQTGDRTLTLTGSNTGVNNLSAAISDATGGGVTSLSKTGAGTWALAGTNAYSGPTNVTGGVLQVASLSDTAAYIPTTSSISLNASTLEITGATANVTTARTLNVTAANLTIDNTSNYTFNGAVSGGALNYTGLGTLTLGGADNNTSLALNITSGNVDLAKSSGSAVSAVAGITAVPLGSTVQLGGTGGNQIADTGAIANFSGKLDMNGRNETLGSITAPAGGGVTTGVITNTAASTLSTLTLGSDGSSTTLSAPINDGAGAMALAKTGAGTLTLAANEGYSGATTISGGTLALQPALASSVTSSLQLYYSAQSPLSVTNTVNGSSIATVYDLSGHGNNAVTTTNAADPTYNAANSAFNNHPTITFSGSQALGNINMTFLNGSQYTIIGLEGKNADPVSGSEYYLGMTTEGTNESLHTGYRSGTDYTLAQYSNDLDYNSNSLAYSGTEVPRVWTGQLDSSGHAIYLNGSSTIVPPATPDTNTTPLAVTTDNNGTFGTALNYGAFFKGDIGAVLMFNTALTPAQLSVVYQYLNYEWGLSVGGSASTNWSSTVLPSSTPVTIAAGATLNLNDAVQTIGSLASSAPTSNVLLGAGLLTTGNDNTNTTFAGAISGAGGLDKIGTGVFNLSGANTYTGPTNVVDGTLAVNGTLASATVTVGNAAPGFTPTLGGGVDLASGGTIDSALHVFGPSNTIGALLGNVTIGGTDGGGSAGVLAPGNSVGTLSVGSLTLGSGSILNYEFNGSANDFTNVTISNGLTLNGGGFDLYHEGTTNPYGVNGVYNLIEYTGTLNGSLTNLSVLDPIAGETYTFSTATVASSLNGMVNVVQLTIVPEPSTWLLASLGLASLAAWRRVLRRRPKQ